MSNQPRCACTRCSIRGLMGPAVITTLGVLFLLGETVRGGFSFSQTYPIVLMVIGGILLSSALAPMDGHISESATSPGIPPAPPAPSQPYGGQRQ